MTKITISKKRRCDYDDEYDLEITTTKKLTQEEYKTIMGGLEDISKILDPHITEKLKAAKEVKK